MQLAKLLNSKGQSVVGKVNGDSIAVLDLPLQGSRTSLSCFQRRMWQAKLRRSFDREQVAISSAKLLPPIDTQEVWAAGVTYKRSQTARMEESETAARATTESTIRRGQRSSSKRRRIVFVELVKSFGFGLMQHGMCRNPSWRW